jgi:hypothetical protein
MAFMHVVQMAIHEVVGMIAVGNSFMSTARAVLVGGFVTAAGVSGAAFLRVVGIHLYLVFVHMIAMHKVHVAIVKETLVPIVHEGRVAAFIAMLVGVSLVNFVSHRMVLL